MLDAQFTLRGSIQIKEYGNAHGLRFINANHSQRDLIYSIRDVFDIPGAADLTLVNVQPGEDQAMEILLQVDWPSFMRRDAGGLRFNYAVTGTAMSRLKRAGEERTMPLHINHWAQQTWRVTLRSAVPLTAQTINTEWENDHRYFKLNIESGSSLKLELTRGGSEGIYYAEQLEEGLKVWEDYIKAYNRMWYEELLFFPNQG